MQEQVWFVEDHSGDTVIVVSPEFRIKKQAENYLTFCATGCTLETRMREVPTTFLPWEV
jgi:hypothetical protein